MNQTELWNRGGVDISPCGLYRYMLYRRWGPGRGVTFIGLNPSTADAEVDDPTIRKSIGFTKVLGYQAFHMLNLFAFRSTSPKAMMQVADPIGPMNDSWLRDYADMPGPVVAMWGNNGGFGERDKAVAAMFPQLTCFGVNQNGSPKHLLYVPYSAELMDFSVPGGDE